MLKLIYLVFRKKTGHAIPDEWYVLLPSALR